MPSVNVVPTVWDDDLLRQRRILVSGPLDRIAVERLCAQLMYLDGESSRPVDLIVQGTGGSVLNILPVLDVIDLMRAPVNTTCIGRALGTAAVLVVQGSGERLIAPSARMSLRCDEQESARGTTVELAKYAEELASARSRLVAALADRTNLDEMQAAAQIDRGGVHTATEAVALGLVDGEADRSRA